MIVFLRTRTKMKSRIEHVLLALLFAVSSGKCGLKTLDDLQVPFSPRRSPDSNNRSSKSIGERVSPRPDVCLFSLDRLKLWTSSWFLLWLQFEHAARERNYELHQRCLARVSREWRENVPIASSSWVYQSTAGGQTFGDRFSIVRVRSDVSRHRNEQRGRGGKGTSYGIVA